MLIVRYLHKKSELLRFGRRSILLPSERRMPDLAAKIVFMSESKAQYIEFCASVYVPMHLQAWWLDAVCTPDGWDVALAFDGGANIIGAMPWYRKHRWGCAVVQLPPFSTYAGPWLRYPEAPGFKLQSRYAFEKKAFQQLIEKIPRSAFFLQNFRPEIENWLPFYWNNFKQSTRYTYIFDQTNNTEAITAGMKNTLRSDLKKAAQLVEWRQENESWEIVFQLNSLSLGRKNRKQTYKIQVFNKLHRALEKRGQMACFIARDKVSGEPHAGLYLAFDARQAAVLLTGTNPEFKASCAIYGLFEAAIRYCGEKGLSLDFEGSMQPEIEHTFRAFGARQVPYFQVFKAKNKFFELLYHFSL